MYFARKKREDKYGGIAQLARAIGSYPVCRRFESHYRYHTARWSSGLRHRPFTAVTRVRIPYESPKSRMQQRLGFLLYRSKN